MIPDSKVHGANMGPIWGRQDPGGPHVGPMNFAIWDIEWNFDTGKWRVNVRFSVFTCFHVQLYRDYHQIYRSLNVSRQS